MIFTIPSLTAAGSWLFMSRGVKDLGPLFHHLLFAATDQCLIDFEFSGKFGELFLFPHRLDSDHQLESLGVAGSLAFSQFVVPSQHQADKYTPFSIL
jgi:hypothetical protein